jgi:hypothetical protein
VRGRRVTVGAEKGRGDCLASLCGTCAAADWHSLSPAPGAPRRAAVGQAGAGASRLSAGGVHAGAGQSLPVL